MPKQLMVVLVLITSVFPIQAFCKDKINPDDFTLSVVVTAVSSQQEIAGTTSQRRSNVDPACTTIGANDPRRARLNCDAQGAGDTTTSRTRSVTVFVVTATIGDKIYELSGPRTELATYHARFVNPSRGHPADIELLAKDKKGKLMAVGYRIVGEHLKDSK